MKDRLYAITVEFLLLTFLGSGAFTVMSFTSSVVIYSFSLNIQTDLFRYSQFIGISLNFPRENFNVTPYRVTTLLCSNNFKRSKQRVSELKYSDAS